MGTSSFSVEVCEALINSGLNVLAVCTKPDSKIGRGMESMPHPLKKFALTRGMVALTPTDLHLDKVARDFKKLKPDLIVLVGYGILVPAQILNLPRYGCLNIHPSLLPKYRGPSPVSSAIINGDCFTGVSVMLMDEGMDTGPVLAQKEVSINSKETTLELTDKLFRIGTDLLIDLIPSLVNQSITPAKQDELQASYSSKILKQDGRIKWNQDAEQILRQVRAFTPWPGTFSIWRGKNFKLLSVNVIETTILPKPYGQISGSVSEGLYVSTGKGGLEIERLQIEGKRSVSAKEFMVGYPDFVKDVLI
mgnify:CR=1 FL=1